MNKLTTIKSIFPSKRKDGTLVQGNSPKTGKQWTMYSIVDKDDVRYGCFESQLTAEMKDGAEVFIDYEVVKKDNFTNNNIKKITAVQKTVNIENPEPSGTKSHSVPDSGLNARLSAIELRLQALEAGQVADLPNEIKESDLPF